MAAIETSPERYVKILVLPGTYDCGNLGDLAMLQICVERLQRCFPGCDLRVLTRTPAELKQHCPAVTPVSLRGRNRWLELFAPAPSPWPRAAFRWGPALSPRRALRWISLLWPGQLRIVREFSAAFFGSDLVVMSGCGGIADPFSFNALRILATFDAARGAGIPAVMLGQGIGPLKSPTLFRAAGQTLSKVNLLTVRDNLHSMEWLSKLGVPDNLIRFTGDDALEMAFRQRNGAVERSLVGVSLRLTDYSGLGGSMETLRRSLVDVARSVKATCVPVPILVKGEGSDLDALETVLPREAWATNSWGPHNPESIIRSISRCRVVIAGSYHAAVFALGQGIPALCLASSDYYFEKFSGLQKLFPEGCIVVNPAKDASLVKAAFTRLWNLRPEPLLRAAETQIRAGRAAYHEIARLLASEGRMPGAANCQANAR